MKRSRLGRASLEVSILGFGAATLGDEYGSLEFGAAQRAVDCALDAGINLFDVAPYYGRTLAEERLGRALAGKRDGVILSTKVGRYGRHLPDGFDFSAARVIRSLEESLRRLRTDVIDLLLAHDIEFGSREQILGETLPAMRALRESGKVRYIGITGFPPALLREVALKEEIDAVLSYCHFNLLNTRLEAELTPLTEDGGIGLINGSPLHMGILTPQGPPSWHPAPPEVVRVARRAAEWCSRQGADISDLALRFALGNEGAHSTLVGMRTEEEVRQNVAALEGPPDPDLLAGVRAILAPVQDVEWPSGLPENNPPSTLNA